MSSRSCRRARAVSCWESEREQGACCEGRGVFLLLAQAGSSTRSVQRVLQTALYRVTAVYSAPHYALNPVCSQWPPGPVSSTRVDPGEHAINAVASRARQISAPASHTAGRLTLNEVIPACQAVFCTSRNTGSAFFLDRFFNPRVSILGHVVALCWRKRVC